MDCCLPSTEEEILTLCKEFSTCSDDGGMMDSKKDINKMSRVHFNLCTVFFQIFGLILRQL